MGDSPTPGDDGSPRARCLRAESQTVQTRPLSIGIDPLHRVTHQISGSGELQLVLDVRTIGFDRLDAEVRLLINSARTQATSSSGPPVDA